MNWKKIKKILENLALGYGCDAKIVLKENIDSKKLDIPGEYKNDITKISMAYRLKLNEVWINKSVWEEYPDRNIIQSFLEEIFHWMRGWEEVLIRDRILRALWDANEELAKKWAEKQSKYHKKEAIEKYF